MIPLTSQVAFTQHPSPTLFANHIVGILAMPEFLKDYGSMNPATRKYMLSAGKQSLVTSIINAGEFLGAVSSYFIGSKIGRKGGLYAACVCVVVGVIF